MKIRLMVQEKYFRSLRERLGMLRQNRPELSQNTAIIAMQKLCGEIEAALYKSRQLIR